MVTIFTNINNHLKRQTIKRNIRPSYMELDIQMLAWDRHINVAGFNSLMGTVPRLNYYHINSRFIGIKICSYIIVRLTSIKPTEFFFLKIQFSNQQFFF